MDSATLGQDGSLAIDDDGIEAVALSCPSPPDTRHRVKTFDIFDTLIARRCIEPIRIFDMVGARAGIAGFTDARRRAEASVAHRPYDLDKIYEALSALLDLTPQQVEALKALEVGFEIENAMPVAENIAAVSDGDVMISDMYLGADVIGRMLDAVGFTPKAALVVTSDGKHSGRIWPLMLDKFAIEEHLGDNLHSDNAMPRRFGIASRHTAATNPNIVEQTLLDVGLRDLAKVCREARLTTWSQDAEVRGLQTIQASLNFPLLALGSIALARLVRREGIGSVLFSSRDCELWLPLYRLIAGRLGVQAPAEYFYTSRLVRTRPSADYLAYARGRIGAQALVVDVCGTGWSLAHLFERLDLVGQQVYFLHKMPPIEGYERRAPAPDTCRVHALIEGVDERCRNMTLEMCNYAEHGMVEDVRLIGDAALPVFAADPRSPRGLAAIRQQRLCFQGAVRILDAQGLDECLSIDDAALRTLFLTLYQCLSQQQVLYAAFARQHLDEDGSVMRALGAA